MDSPLVCDLDAIPAGDRSTHNALAETIFSSVIGRRELEDGYTVQLPVDCWVDVARWASLERLCCPFLDFSLNLSREGDFWLSIIGPDGVKGILASLLQTESDAG